MVDGYGITHHFQWGGPSCFYWPDNAENDIAFLTSFLSRYWLILVERRGGFLAAYALSISSWDTIACLQIDPFQTLLEEISTKAFSNYALVNREVQ